MPVPRSSTGAVLRRAVGAVQFEPDPAATPVECCAPAAGPYCGCQLSAPCRLVACDGFSIAFPLAASLAVAGSSVGLAFIGGTTLNGFIANVPAGYSTGSGPTYAYHPITNMAEAEAYATNVGPSAIKYAITHAWTGGTLAIGPDDFRTLGPSNGGCVALAIGYYRRYLLADGTGYVFDGLMTGMPKYAGSVSGTLVKSVTPWAVSSDGEYDRLAEWSFHPIEDTRYVVRAFAQPTGAQSYVPTEFDDDPPRYGLAAVEVVGRVAAGVEIQVRSHDVNTLFGADAGRTQVLDDWYTGGAIFKPPGAPENLPANSVGTGGYVSTAGLYGFNAAAYNESERACCATVSLPVAWGDAGTTTDQFGAAMALPRPATVTGATFAPATSIADPGSKSAPRWIRVVYEYQRGAPGPYQETYRYDLIMVQTCGPAQGPFVPGPFGGGTGGPAYRWPTSAAWGVHRTVSATLTTEAYGTEDIGSGNFGLAQVSPILWRLTEVGPDRDEDTYDEWGAIRDSDDVVHRYIKHASSSPVGMTDIEQQPIAVDANPPEYVERYGDTNSISYRRTYTGFRTLGLLAASITVTETTPEADLGCACDCPTYASMNQVGYAAIALTRTPGTVCAYTGTGASVAWDSTGLRWVATRGSDVAYKTGNPLGIYTNGSVTINVG